MNIRAHLLYLLYAILVFTFIAGVFLCSNICRRRSRHVPRHSVKLCHNDYWSIANEDAEQALIQDPGVRKLNTGLLGSPGEQQEANLPWQ